MPRIPRFVLALLACLFAAVRTSAQVVDSMDQPRPQATFRPPTQKELDQREALYQFARGVLCEQEDRLLEALDAYENAAQLDPQAVTILKSLAMIYIAVGRQDDAAALLQNVLQLSPHDYEMSYLYARLLRSRGKLEEACAVLDKGLQSKGLRDRPDLHLEMEYDLGALNERLEKPVEAAAAFGRAAAILDHPDGLEEELFSPEEVQMRSAEVQERIGRNLVEAREFDAAAAAFRRAQNIYPPGASRLHYYLAQVSLHQGKLIEAKTSLSDYLQMLPQGTEAYELMIGVMQKLQRDADIVPWLEQASAKDTFNVALRLLLARQCIRAGQFAKAEKIYRDLAASGPTAQIYRDLFLLYTDHYPAGGELVGEMVSAAFAAATGENNRLANNPAPAQARAMVAALRENASLARDVLPATALLAQRKPLPLDALQVFAAIADRLDMLPEAEVFYRQCITQPLPAATEPLIYGGMLRVLWKARHYDAVVAACRTGLKQTQASNRVLLRAELARALSQLQRPAEALAEADQAVSEAKDSERFTIQRLRVGILTRAGKIAEAEAECQALLKEHTLLAEVLEIRYLLASVYSTAKRLPQAEAELAACLKIDPDNVAVNNDLGYLWADQNKNLAEAEAMIRKAIELDRKNRQGLLALRPGVDKEFHDNACYIDSLGWVLCRRGQLEAARKELEYAATLPDGDDPVIWDHLGDVHLALGQREQALAAWRQALHFYAAAKDRKMDERWRALRDKVKCHNVKEAPCQAIPTGRPSSTKKGPSTPSVASCGAS